MLEVTTFKAEKRICADTASGQSAQIDWQAPFSSQSGWTTGTTMSVMPMWTSPIIAGREPNRITTQQLTEVTSTDRKVVFDTGLALTVTIEYDSDLFVVSDERFGLYGSGESKEDALADYSASFIEFFSDLLDSRNVDLPPSTRRFKRTLLAFGKLIERD